MIYVMFFACLGEKIILIRPIQVDPVLTKTPMIYITRGYIFGNLMVFQKKAVGMIEINGK